MAADAVIWELAILVMQKEALSVIVLLGIMEMPIEQTFNTYQLICQENYI